MLIMGNLIILSHHHQLFIVDIVLGKSQNFQRASERAAIRSYFSSSRGHTSAFPSRDLEAAWSEAFC